MSKEYYDRKDGIYIEFDKAMKELQNKRDKSLSQLKNNFNKQSEMLSSQISSVKSYLKDIETCEKECLTTIASSPTNNNPTNTSYTSKSSKNKKGKGGKGGKDNKNTNNEPSIAGIVTKCIKSNRPKLYDVPCTFDSVVGDGAGDSGDDEKGNDNNESEYDRLKWSDKEKDDDNNGGSGGGGGDDEKDASENKSKKKWRESLEIGSKVDGFEKIEKKEKDWYSGTIITKVVLPDETIRVEVTFDGYSDDYDAFFNLNSKGLAKHGTHSTKHISVKDVKEEEEDEDDDNDD